MFAYIRGNYSINLTTSAGQYDFKSIRAHTERPFEERIILCAQYLF